MSATAYLAGQTVYGPDGQEAEYLMQYDGQHLVVPIFEKDRETGEPIFGDPVLWGRVFKDPPAPRIAEEIAKLEERARALRNEVAELRLEKVEAERSQKERLAKLSEHRALARIEDFLEGRFTHFLHVTKYDAPRLLTKAETLKPGDHFSSDLKLLSLFGSSKGDLLWRVNDYYEGSGSWQTVYPVQSEEEARSLVRELFAKHVKEWRESGRKAWSEAIAWAEKLPVGWVDVPEDLATHIRDSQLSHLRERETKSREEHERALAALREAGATS